MDRGQRIPSLSLTAPELVFRTRTLSGVLAELRARPAAELVDLGPVVGSNIAFFGERLPCKIHVEDLYADLERHRQQGTLDRFPEFLSTRFPRPDASIDAVLCWDVFDYLEAAAAQALAGELMRLLRPEGVLLAFFAAGAPADTGYPKYIIEDDEHLRRLAVPGAGRRRTALENRDIVRLFDRLQVADFVLLRSRLRELLFRKPTVSPAVLSG